MRRFELVRGLTRRFWHVTVEGAHVTVTTGVTGTPAQPLTATFPSAQAALAEEERLVKERLGWGYVELEPMAEPDTGKDLDKEELPVSPASPAAAPVPAASSPEEVRPDRAERAARAAAARRSSGGIRRRSGPSKKLMGLPPQALALTVSTSDNRRVRRDAMLTLVAQAAPETPRWVAESLLDADEVIRAAAEEYFARSPALIDAAAAADPKVSAAVAGRLPQLKAELAPPAKEAALKDLPAGLNEGSRAQEAGAFWSAAALSRPELLGGGAGIPLDAVRALVEMLRTAPDNRASFVRWRQTCTPSSLEAFAFSLVRGFLASGAGAEDAWALRALIAFGADRACHRLVQLALHFSEEGARDRARNAVSALGELGSDAALAALHKLEVELGRGALAGEARQALADAARRRGLDPESLADRLVDTLGLGPDGTRVLGKGPQAPRAALDASLHLVLRDAQGNPLPRFPKAAGDDAALAEAEQAWTTLRAAAPRVVAEQVRRLELAMASRRRWARDDFLAGIAGHPVLRAIARGLVFAAGDATRVALFTLDASGAPVDVAGARVTLPEGPVSVVHLLQLDEAPRAAWAAAFAAAGRPPPFRQLDRPLFQLSVEEVRSRATSRHAGRAVSAAKLAGLIKRGWKLGPTDGASEAVRALRKPVGTSVAQLAISPGLPGRTLVGAPSQVLGEVSWAEAGPLAQVEASELLYDLSALEEPAAPAPLK